MAILNSAVALCAALSEPSGLWEKLLLGVFDFVANYGWRVVLFTLCLKVLLSPLDIYQRYKARKNQKIMEGLKPEMEKLAKQYPDRGILAQKQMELNKKAGISYASSCLPSIVTLVLFITLLVGMNNISYYTNFKDYYELYTEYNQVIAECEADGVTGDAAVDKAQSVVYEKYQENKTGFLWIKNIWSPDVPWRGEVNDRDEFIKNIGKYATNLEKSGLDQATLDDMKAQYPTVMAKLLDEENNKANGYLVLPVLSIALSFLTQWVMQRQQKKSGQLNENMGGSMKFMMWLMPIMMGYFSLQYTAAFSLYLITQYIVSLLITLASGLIGTMLDKRDENAKKNDDGIIKYGRPDPNDYNN